MSNSHLFDPVKQVSVFSVAAPSPPANTVVSRWCNDDIFESLVDPPFRFVIFLLASVFPGASSHAFTH